MKELQHTEQRVAVLIDIQNMYYSAKHLYNTKVNFKEIMRTAVSGRRLVRAIGYAIKADVKDENVFHDALNKVGIEVKAKDLLVFHGGSKKGDWDIGIAMDAVRLSNKIDTLVLVSGDGDFKDLLTYLKQHGLRTEVLAFSKTASIFIKQEADQFVDLEKDKSKYLINYKENKTYEKKTYQPKKEVVKQQSPPVFKKVEKKVYTDEPNIEDVFGDDEKKSVTQKTSSNAKKETVQKPSVKEETPKKVTKKVVEKKESKPKDSLLKRISNKLKKS